MSALAQSPPDPQPAVFTAVAGLRFGITVSRRQARRAVARNMVKRVLRESARQRAPHLEAALAGQQVDVLFRLKAPLPDAAAAGWSDVKAQLRREADSLLGQLHDALRAGNPIAGVPFTVKPGRGPAQAAAHSLAQSTSAQQSTRKLARPKSGAVAQAARGAQPAAMDKPAGN
jgi:RNase P protein component